MDIAINNSPGLSMPERMKKLFNNNFLSDVQFLVDDRTIYAHSLQLMLCSVVFQNQLEVTLGEKKLIPINDVCYHSAYQFLRFIYTDEFDVNEANVIDILKLAKRYKVIKLENEIFSFINRCDLWLKLYEHCLLVDDEHHLRRSRGTLFKNLEKILLTDQFLTLHPIAMEEILKSDYANVSEVQLFEALARWTNQNSKDNQIDDAQQAAHYEKFVQLIRFPVMPAEEVMRCLTNHRRLFKDDDLKTIAQAQKGETNLWNSRPRESLHFPYTYQAADNFDTHFTVSRKMFITGLRFGRCADEGIIGIMFTQKNCAGDLVKQFKFDCKSSQWNTIVFNLGESIELQPKLEYIIAIGLCQNGNLRKSKSKTFSRDKNTDVFINVPTKFIRFNRVCSNIFEMYFKLVE